MSNDKTTPFMLLQSDEILEQNHPHHGVACRDAGFYLE